MGLIPILSPCAAKILNLFHGQCRDVFVVSAFLRVEAVSEMLARLLTDRTVPCRLRVLTRANLPDIATGSSDVASLTLLTKSRHPSLSIECRRDPRLHAKAYLVDSSMGIITSANLTPSGLLTNIEFGFFIDSADVVKSILDYLEPIWKMAEVVGERILKDLSSEAQQIIENEAPLELDIDPKYTIRKKQLASVKRKKPLARLPVTDTVRMDTKWEELDKLGLNVEAMRSIMHFRRRRPSSRTPLVRPTETATPVPTVTWLGMTLEQVYNVKEIEELKVILTSPHWEFREAAAEALGNISEEKATQVLLQALRREKDRDVIWSILLSLKPKITESNLNQVFELLNRTDDRDLIYSVYLIAATVKPQEYASMLISNVPDFSDSECANEVAMTLRPLSNDEFVEVVRNFKEKGQRLGRQLFLLFLSQGRGEAIERKVRTLVFPKDSEEASTEAASIPKPLIDSVIDSLKGRRRTSMWRIPKLETSGGRLNRPSRDKTSS